ncbi:hypothetical protein HDV05_005940 [Chytridiales sp. JEL 0842]|nr:hypothetical protein HDV05_005940 [Chytridiales sp. JEL 0842]
MRTAFEPLAKYASTAISEAADELATDAVKEADGERRDGGDDKASDEDNDSVMISVNLFGELRDTRLDLINVIRQSPPDDLNDDKQKEKWKESFESAQLQIHGGSFGNDGFLLSIRDTPDTVKAINVLFKFFPLSGRVVGGLRCWISIPFKRLEEPYDAILPNTPAAVSTPSSPEKAVIPKATTVYLQLSRLEGFLPLLFLFIIV